MSKNEQWQFQDLIFFQNDQGDLEVSNVGVEELGLSEAESLRDFLDTYIGNHKPTDLPVLDRYARLKPDGSRETFNEIVERVAAPIKAN